MKRLFKLPVIIFLLFFSLFPFNTVIAQEGENSLLLENVDLAGHPDAVLQLNAWGVDGLPLDGLAVGDFSIREDGGSPITPAELSADDDAPLSLVLVVDVSHSMQGEPLDDARVAAARFLDRLSEGDRVALIAFSDQIDPDPAVHDLHLESDFTSDLEPLYDLVEGLQTGGGTHLYHAMSKAVQMAAQEPAGHRAVLLLSDGRNDPAGVGSSEEPLQLAREAHIPLFIIGLGNDIDEPYLYQLASETGGLLRLAPRSSELAELFADMATLLKTQYSLKYRSGLALDGESHVIELSLNTGKGNVSSSIETACLPYQAVATEAPVQAPVVVSDAADSPLSTEIPAATPLPAFIDQMTMVLSGSPILFFLLLILVLVVFLWLLIFRRRKSVTREACARCGFDMTGRSGACPECGEMRRLSGGKRK